MTAFLVNILRDANMSDEQGDGQLPSAEEAIQQQQEENESQQEVCKLAQLCSPVQRSAGVRT